MVGVASKLIQQPVHVFFGVWQFAGQIGIDDGVDIVALVQVCLFHTDNAEPVRS